MGSSRLSSKDWPRRLITFLVSASTCCRLHFSCHRSIWWHVRSFVLLSIFRFPLGESVSQFSSTFLFLTIVFTSDMLGDAKWANDLGEQQFCLFCQRSHHSRYGKSVRVWTLLTWTEGKTPPYTPTFTPPTSYFASPPGMVSIFSSSFVTTTGMLHLHDFLFHGFVRLDLLDRSLVAERDWRFQPCNHE